MHAALNRCMPPIHLHHLLLLVLLLAAGGHITISVGEPACEGASVTGSAPYVFSNESLPLDNAFEHHMKYDDLRSLVEVEAATEANSQQSKGLNEATVTAPRQLLQSNNQSAPQSSSQADGRCVVPTFQSVSSATSSFQCLQQELSEDVNVADMKAGVAAPYCPCTAIPMFRWKEYLSNPANGNLCILQCEKGHRCSRSALDVANSNAARSSGARELSQVYGSLSQAYGICIPCTVGEYCESGTVEFSAADIEECERVSREAAKQVLQRNNLVLGAGGNLPNVTVPPGLQAPPGVPPVLQASPAVLARAPPAPSGNGSVSPRPGGRRLMQTSLEERLVYKQCNSLMLCPPGFYCPTPTEKVECQEGTFCSGAAVKERTCSMVDTLTDNPFSTVWSPPNFLFQSAKDSRSPLSGNYCPRQSATPFGKCARGSVCKDPSKQVQCKKGQYCPQGSYTPRKCTFLFRCDRGAAKARWGQFGLVVLVVILSAIMVLFHVVIHTRARRIVAQQKEESLLDFVTSLGFLVGRQGSQPQQSFLAQLFSFFQRDETKSSVDSSTVMLSHKEAAPGYGVISTHLSVQFRNLSLVIGGGKCVLKDVTGEFPHSQMHALMGPSGCGKSTFMNTLCGKASYGKTTGHVAIRKVASDGTSVPYSFESLRYITGYVPQEDIVHEVLTVRENLFFAAKLRLPHDSKKKDVYDVVNCVLHLLGLAHVEHSVVGSVETRGISGGQRKRVNIGMELVARPSLLFLDEPTSGLDSAVSNDVLESLRKMCQSGMNVIMVIHQPRYSIFEMFDSVLLLGVGGRTVYLGPVVLAMPYFTEVGFPLPRNENPADFYLDVISGAVSRIEDEDFVPNQLFDMWVETGQEWVSSKNQALLSGAKVEEVAWVHAPAGGNFLARSWPWRPKDLQTIHDRFNILDVNRDGYLTFSEFTEFWSGLRAIMTSEQYEEFVEDMILDFGISKDDVVTKDSFMSTVKAKLRSAEGEDVETSRSQGSLRHMPTMARKDVLKSALEQQDSKGRPMAKPGSRLIGGLRAGMGQQLQNIKDAARPQQVSATAKSAGTAMLQEAWGTVAMLGGWSSGGRALPTVWRQIYIVILRDRTKSLNDWVTFLFDILLLAAFAVLIALVQGDTSNIVRLTAPLTMMLASLALLLSVTGLRTFGSDNVIFLQRESLGGLSTTAYTLGHMLWDVVYMVPRPLIFIVFYLMMMWPEALDNHELFAKLVGVVILVAWYAYSFGYLMSVLLSKQVAMVAAAGLPLVFGAIINGVSTKLPEIPTGGPVDLLTHLSYGRWAIEAIIIAVAQSTYKNPSESTLIYGYFTTMGFCGGLNDIQSIQEQAEARNRTMVKNKAPPVPPTPYTPNMSLPLGNVFIGPEKSLTGGKLLSDSTNKQVNDLSKVIYFYNNYTHELDRCDYYFNKCMLWLFFLGTAGRLATFLFLKYKVWTRATK